MFPLCISQWPITSTMRRVAVEIRCAIWCDASSIRFSTFASCIRRVLCFEIDHFVSRSKGGGKHQSVVEWGNCIAIQLNVLHSLLFYI